MVCCVFASSPFTTVRMIFVAFSMWILRLQQEPNDISIFIMTYHNSELCTTSLQKCQDLPRGPEIVMELIGLLRGDDICSNRKILLSGAAFLPWVGDTCKGNASDICSNVAITECLMQLSSRWICQLYQPQLFKNYSRNSISPVHVWSLICKNWRFLFLLLKPEGTALSVSGNWEMVFLECYLPRMQQIVH